MEGRAGADFLTRMGIQRRREKRTPHARSRRSSSHHQGRKSLELVSKGEWVDSKTIDRRRANMGCNREGVKDETEEMRERGRVCESKIDE